MTSTSVPTDEPIAAGRPGAGTHLPLRQRIAAELERARRRTLALTDVPDDVGRAQIDPLMSPLVWDLAHIGNYEEQWLLRALGAAPLEPALDALYDAFEHPRWTRPDLPILGLAAARAYDARVRDAVLDLLEDVALDPTDALRREGFVYGMVIQHEHQHDETMLATHQLRGTAATGAPGARPARWAATPPSGPAMVRIDGGPAVIGTTLDEHPWSYDNERDAHEVVLPPFLLDRHPVTNRAHLAFVDDGGYDDPRLWSEEGWAWRQEAALVAPQFWEHHGGGDWTVLRFGRRIPLPLDEPVQHVCWYEAEAHARWAGARLPTEAEWEKAATWHPAEGRRRWPWGAADPTPLVANLGGRHDGPAPVGALPGSASPCGAQQMIGDVWEWTSSDFLPHPGFAAFPYREYSEVFWGGDYKVLKGGSWAADVTAVRPSFRNWDHPIRRQIFAGFRCARDD